MQKVSRRALLHSAAVGAGGLWLAACQPQVVQVEKVVEVEKVVTAAPVAKAPVKLEWWFCDYGQNGLNAAEKSIVPGFKQEFPHIDVQVVYSPWGKWGEMELTAFAAGTMADVFQPYTEVIPDMARTKRAVPLDAYVEVSNIVKQENYAASIWDFFVQNGQVYGVPWRNDIRSVQYRKSALEKAGVQPPSDWDSLVTVASKLTMREGDQLIQAGLEPFPGVPYGPTQVFVPLLWQCGGEVLTPDNKKTAFNSPEGEMAVDYMVEAYGAVWPVPEAGLEQTPVPHFVTGKLAMNLNGGVWLRGQLEQYAPDLMSDLGIVVPPFAGRGPKARPVTLQFPSPWCMSTRGQAKDPDTAWILVEYLTRPLVALTWMRAGGTVTPVEKNLAALPYFSEDPHYNQYIQLQNEYGMSMPSWPRTFDLYKFLSDRITEVWFGQTTAKEALQAAADYWDPILEKEA